MNRLQKTAGAATVAAQEKAEYAELIEKAIEITLLLTDDELLTLLRRFGYEPKNTAVKL